jgi:murein DD-endopeptidase MepM/ murein hydrolase activator NlpD
VVTRADWFSSYGLFISLDHGAQLETRYGHLSRLNVAEGQVVKKGDLIGYVGSTGRSTGPHLHYEVRIAGTAVNPVPYMQGDAWTGTLAANDADGETAKGGSK